MSNLSFKEKWSIIIFKSDTKNGKLFDLVLFWAIILSITITILDSIPSLSKQLNDLFYGIEWFFTILFSLEYIARIYVIRKPAKYIFSFWGFIDLMAIIPTYLSIFFYGYQHLMVIRIFRLLRIFRILRLVRFNKEAQNLTNSLKGSIFKIAIFFSSVLALVVLLGSIMYVVEGGENGFDSIPQSVYWAIITITTVGYGDIVPMTVLGKFISAFTMIIGYAIIAVPTGIVTAEITRNKFKESTCTSCNHSTSFTDKYCGNCGAKLIDKEK